MPANSYPISAYYWSVPKHYPVPGEYSSSDIRPDKSNLSIVCECGDTHSNQQQILVDGFESTGKTLHSWDCNRNPGTGNTGGYHHLFPIEIDDTPARQSTGPDCDDGEYDVCLYAVPDGVSGLYPGVRIGFILHYIKCGWNYPILHAWESELAQLITWSKACSAQVRISQQNEVKMGFEKTTIEIIAPNIEEAISRGVEELGVSKDDVLIEVLDEGSRGLFGLGGRNARVRLTFRIDNDKHDDTQIEDSIDSTVVAMADEQVFELTPLEVAKTVTYDLLDRMKVKAQVDICYGEHEEGHDQKTINVDIKGDDLSILIGRKSETLNALQYIVGLIVSKKLGYWVPLTLDVQGYRSRRENQLRRLARKMAEQAIQTGRRQYLEPMPANERRMIHLELCDNEQIKTESVGEEPSRKVTITLRK